MRFSALLMILILSGSALAVTVNLNGPKDGAVITQYTQEFIYSFSEPVEIDQCDLVIDSQVAATRNDLIFYSNNKITATLAPGDHEWMMKCTDIDGNVLESASRKITLDASVEEKESYETIYNKNGLRSYLIVPFEGQKPVELPALKNGEDLQFKTVKGTSYVDLLKMGSSGNTFFVELRDRDSGRIGRILVGEAFDINVSALSPIPVSIELLRVERSVNAFLKVYTYVGSNSVSEPTPVEPEEPVVTPVDEPIETPQAPVVEPEAKPAPAEPKVEAQEQPEASKVPTWLIISLVLSAILIIVLIISKRPNQAQQGSGREK